MITWGKIEGKPLFLGNTNNSNNNNKKQYLIPESPLRDELALKMVNKSMSKKRDEKLREKLGLERKLG